MTDSVFHSGELEVQRRVGVERMAARVGSSIHRDFPPAAEEFLAQRSWVVLSTTDARGRPWASVLRGRRGFVSVGPGILHLDARPTEGDPLNENLRTSPFVGLLAIDLETRRRMRVNARLEQTHFDGLLLRAEQVYSNCPKYIQRRVQESGAPPQLKGEALRSGALTDSHREWIARADTFFIATVNPGEGADASHRGGAPGFIQVDGDRISWPDYQGNMMFNTLGNIAVFPRAGLLVPDFTTGKTLLVCGRASVNWDPAAAALVPGAERLVELTVEDAVELQGAAPGGMALVDYSPHLPPSPLGRRRSGVPK